MDQNFSYALVWYKTFRIYKNACFPCSVRLSIYLFPSLITMENTSTHMRTKHEAAPEALIFKPSAHGAAPAPCIHPIQPLHVPWSCEPIARLPLTQPLWQNPSDWPACSSEWGATCRQGEREGAAGRSLISLFTHESGRVGEQSMRQRCRLAPASGTRSQPATGAAHGSWSSWCWAELCSAATFGLDC